MSNVIDVTTCSPQASDRFFFDTNIWMFLYCPIGNYRKEEIRKYANFFKKVITAKSTILISSLMLSEFFNAYIRMEFKICQNKEPLKYKYFKKDFRGTDVYRNSINEIKAIIKTQILKCSKKMSDRFESVNFDETFKNIDKSDFNDEYFCFLAKVEDFKIVTNDRDFKNERSDISIITADSRMLGK